MKVDKKINRDLLVFLLSLEVSKRKISALFKVSTRSLFTYLQDFPVSETELSNFSINDINSLMECLEKILVNSEYFRLPENFSKEDKQKYSIF